MQTYTDLSQALKEPDKVQILDLEDQGLTEIPVEILQLTNLNYNEFSSLSSHPIRTMTIISSESYICLTCNNRMVQSGISCKFHDAITE